VSHETVEYRGYKIYWDPKPVPQSMIGYWSFVSDDYDGAEDSNDGRCGDAESVEDAKRQIDEQIADAEWVPPSADPIIAKFPPQDGKEYDCQCARCGSSADHQSCEQCAGDGYDWHDCGEDCCSCAEPEDNVRCDICQGDGGWYFCLSSPGFCEANPLPGRDHIKRGKIEWFPIAQLAEGGQ
jgi:hypothetical protein